MKKALKIALITLGSFLVLLAIAAFAGWTYLKSTFLNFEGETDKRTFKEISADGFKFLDRNSNGKLDVYEDDRKSLEERTKDLLSQMTLEEKIHLLKGSGLGSAMGMEKGLPGAVGTIVATPRLGIPAVYLSDGRQVCASNPNEKGKTELTIALPSQSVPY